MGTKCAPRAQKIPRGWELWVRQAWRSKIKYQEGKTHPAPLGNSSYKVLEFGTKTWGGDQIIFLSINPCLTVSLSANAQAPVTQGKGEMRRNHGLGSWKHSAAALG